MTVFSLGFIKAGAASYVAPVGCTQPLCTDALQLIPGSHIEAVSWYLIVLGEEGLSLAKRSQQSSPHTFSAERLPTPAPFCRDALFFFLRHKPQRQLMINKGTVWQEEASFFLSFFFLPSSTQRWGSFTCCGWEPSSGFVKQPYTPTSGRWE